MIEFRNCVIGGMNFIAANLEDKILCLLATGGSELRSMGAVIRYDHVDQILTKMKELQGEESPLADLASKQEPLGEPFQTILNDNMKDLYEP